MAIFASNLAPASTDRALGSAVIERSLRFNNFSSSQDDATLTRTVGTTSNRKTFTHSFWVKRARLGGNMVFGHTDGAGSYFFNFVFNGDDKIEFNEYRYNESPSNKIRLITTRVFRDVTSWYHIVTAVDTTQGTAADRVKIYVNGVQETAFDTAIYCDQNHDTYFNSTSPYPIMRIGLNGWGYTGLNGYLAEFNAVDGYAYDPSYFGFTDSQTGNWMPKRYEGTYGTNGYRLDFSDNSSTSTLGIDKSPNGNDFTATNFSVSAGTGNDSLEDTPTNNFPILSELNSIVRENTFPAEIREAGLLMTGGDCHAAATFRLPKSGKWYVEFPKYGNGAPQAISVTRAHKEPYQYDGYLGLADHVQYVSNGEIGNRTRGSTSDAPTWQDDADIIVAMAVDMDNGAVYFAREDTWINSGVPTSGSAKTGAIATDLLTDNDGEHYIGVQGYNGNNNYGMYANFGQRPFTYTPPTGYKKLCAKNLPPNVPSIVRPQRYFDNLLYTGTGSSNIVEGLEFSPDMIWVKGRDTNGTEHMIIDSVRGGDASLVPSSTDTESTHGGRSMTFYPGGVRWNSDSNTCNSNGENYILWCWKGGGSSSTFNIDGKGYTTAAAAGLDGGSLNPTGASINTKSGFSILTYTGTNNVSETIAHGLGKKPAWIIVKSRNIDGQDWVMYHKKLDEGNQPATHILKLNVSNTEADINDVWQDTEPTSSVFTIGTEAMVNHQDGHLYVAYCWSEIPGFSKFGSYEANGDSNGPYVHCGFRPALILIKNTSLAQPWVLMDNKINPYNLADTRLSTSNNNGDHTSGDNYIDFLADGFKVRSGSSTDINYSTSYPNHVYMAFAEIPSPTPFDMFPNAR